MLCSSQVAHVSIIIIMIRYYFMCTHSMCSVLELQTMSLHENVCTLDRSAAGLTCQLHLRLSAEHPKRPHRRRAQSWGCCCTPARAACAARLWPAAGQCSGTVSSASAPDRGSAACSASLTCSCSRSAQSACASAAMQGDAQRLVCTSQGRLHESSLTLRQRSQSI